MPRKILMKALHPFLHVNNFLEKQILKLTYEVRGQEHLPSSPPYIIAAKHQSAYETFKLHLLFKNPAIILKKELTQIPLWGRYLKKSDVIAIDRSSPKSAIRSMKEGARRVTEQQRPIVIFPQGTRVNPGTTTKEKPYKMGITRIQKETNLPIIPMATNAGLYYPKSGWIKKPGCVVLEFLPPIMPSQNNKPIETLKMLETTLEKKSEALLEEGRKNLKETLKETHTNNPFKKASLIAFLVLFTSYSAYWFYTAHNIRNGYESWLSTQPAIESAPLKLYGYPGEMKAHISYLAYQTPQGLINIKDITAKNWPFPATTIHLKTGKIALRTPIWLTPLSFDSLQASLKEKNKQLTIMDTTLTHGETKASINGTVKTQETYPDINLNMELKNYENFLTELTEHKIIDKKTSAITAFILKTFEKEGRITTTLSTQNNVLYLGPIRIYEFQ